MSPTRPLFRGRLAPPTRSLTSPTSPTSPARWRFLLALAPLLTVVAACGNSTQSGADAGTDFLPVDMPPVSDATPKPLALDFSATGCLAFDPTTSRCSGTAPLTLTFTPIASEELTRFLWTFGDDTPFSSERSPTHTYAFSGDFDVMLSAGGGEGVGSVQQAHRAYVHVMRAPTGAVCDIDVQCEPGLSCLCGSTSPCAPVFARGFCGRPCDAAAGGPSTCPLATTCADLSASSISSTVGPASAGMAWRRPSCLPRCVDDTDCAAGFRCRDLLSAAPAAGWVRACFGDYPLSVGTRCGDDTGKPIDADCASRLCADLGAYGRCSADCSVADCPTGAACARFGDGRALCLAACATASSCTDDPLLACEAPGAAGPLGFTVTGPTPPPPKLCAPKRCSTPADCGRAGSCVAGHCARGA